MDRLDAMRMLVASVDEGSFSAAGRKLGIPLPTVSRNIAELEAHLQTQLLVRSTRQLLVTDTGAAYVAACRRILEAIGDAETAASGEHLHPRGELTLAAPIVFGRLYIVPIVSEFLASFPEINIKMSMTDQPIDPTDDRVDVAVRIGELPDSAMIATRVGAIRRVICASPSYLSANGTPSSPEDLPGHRCVTFSGAASGTSWSFASKRGKPRLLRPLCRLKVNTAEAAIDAAIAGVGLTNVFSYQAYDAVKRGQLNIVLSEFEPEDGPVHLVHAAHSLLPLKTRAFLKFAAPRLRRALGDALLERPAVPAASRSDASGLGGDDLDLD